MDLHTDLSPPSPGDPEPGQPASASSRLRAGPAELVALSLYIALVAWAIPFHEPWADEAQAWQIARTLSLPGIFHALHYEGHPSLWYLLLWTLSRLHVSYAGMHWIAGAIAVAGVAVLLVASPFPRFVKLLLPFTFYLAFQYAIVARTYVMAPLLLFLCAWSWPLKHKHPWLLALCLGLLANVALHTAVVSGGLAVAWLADIYLERRKPGFAIPWRKLSVASLLLLLLYVAAAWTAFPARDASGGGLVVRPNPQMKQWLATQQSQLPPLMRPEPLHKRSLDWISWKAEARLAPGLTQGLTRPFWFGCLFWVALVWKLFKARKLHYLLPPLLFVIFCADIYAWFWHSGLMLPCVLCLLWITSPPQDSPFRSLPSYEQLPLLLLTCVALIQMSWAVFAFTFDHRHEYAPARATAGFLEPFVSSHARILEIGDDFLSVGVQPYFSGPIYLNQPYAFYWWSTHNTGKTRYQELLPTRPEIVVLEWRFRQADPPPSEVARIPLAQQLVRAGYRNSHTFCGGLVQPGFEHLEWDCDLIFQPSPAAPEVVAHF